ncbi:MAG: type II toxin-antitoxin system VapC family toxin [Magnetococcales bacterium]|nr:type II toxin-antitoxin system VapC family toxin [Magnetococcales bacterium]
MLHMLDTDTVSYLLKKKSPALEQRLFAFEPSQLCISVMTLAELRYGLKRLPRDHRLHSAVEYFLKMIRVLSWGAEATDWYAEIRYQLVTHGQPIGELDMMIAAHALSVDAVLVTNNINHFQRIGSPLRLENWT